MHSIDKTHTLNNNQIAILKGIIGQQLLFICAADVSVSTGLQVYDFGEAINLQLSATNGYVAITGLFDETNLGEDFIDLRIEYMPDPIGIQRISNGGLLSPYSSLQLTPDFTIKSIDVFGYSYKVTSSNNRTEPYWKIERNYPNTPIQEHIETQNILLLHATDGRQLLIKPLGAVPWMQVTLDATIIQKLLNQRNLDGAFVIKLKRQF